MLSLRTMTIGTPSAFAVIIATQEPTRKRREGGKSLLVIDSTDESTGTAVIRPANWLCAAAEKAAK